MPRSRAYEFSCTPDAEAPAELGLFVFTTTHKGRVVVSGAHRVPAEGGMGWQVILSVLDWHRMIADDLIPKKCHLHF